MSRPRWSRQVLSEAELIVREEADRRESAFAAAVAEMDRPRLTTETILDTYLATVLAGEVSR